MVGSSVTLYWRVLLPNPTCVRWVSSLGFTLRVVYWWVLVALRIWLFMLEDKPDSYYQELVNFIMSICQAGRTWQSAVVSPTSAAMKACVEG